MKFTAIPLGSAITAFFSLLMAFSLWCNPMVNGWGAESEVYYGFIYSGIFSILLIGLMVFKNYDIRLTSTDLLVLTFVVYSHILSYILTSSKALYIKDELLTLYTLLFPTLLVKEWLFSNKKLILKIIGLVVICQICLGIYQIIAALLISTPFIIHVRGSFNNSGIYCIFLTCTLPALIFLSTSLKNGFARIAYKGFIFLPLLISLIVQSRTSIIIGIIAFTMMYWEDVCIVIKAITGQLKAFPFILTILGIVVLTGIIYLKYPSAYGRLFIWELSFQMFLQRPIFGWGIGGFSENYMNFQESYFIGNVNTWGDIDYIAGPVYLAFNFPIQLLVETGIIGVVIFVVFMREIYMVKVNNKITYIYKCIFYLIFTSSLFYYSLSVTPVLFLFLICAILIGCETSSKLEGKALKTWGFLAVSIILFYSYTQFRATIKWEIAKENVLVAENDSFKQYLSLYDQLNHRGKYLFNYGAELYEAGHYYDSINILNECKTVYPSVECNLYLGKAYEKIRKYDLAGLYYKKASYMVPSLFTPKYFLTKLYEANGKMKEAKIMANKILKMKVKIPSSEVDQIRKEMKILLER